MLELSVSLPEWVWYPITLWVMVNTVTSSISAYLSYKLFKLSHETDG